MGKTKGLFQVRHEAMVIMMRKYVEIGMMIKIMLVDEITIMAIHGVFSVSNLIYS